MRIIALLLVAFVALSHVGFLVLEMFYSNTPVGHDVFKTTPEFAASSAVLAANQGLYNGFLAAGLIWSLILGPEGIWIRIFFLTCVLIAGLYGAATVGKKILYVQALPALIALVLTHLPH
jgi:putative membrane protein